MELTEADLRHNFELERELAERLRAASPTERRAMYATIYDEYFQRARNVRHTLPNPRETARQVRLVTRFLPPRGRYLELGAGTCHVARRVAEAAASAYALEVSREVIRDAPDVQILLSDGVTIPLPDASVDLVFSNQLMEHLHPDDAEEQISEVRRVLAAGGRYVCITPNALTGPHDISAHFGEIPRGFHLREWTIRELSAQLRTAGFSRVDVAVALGGEVLVQVPGPRYGRLEAALARLPRGRRRAGIVRKLLDPGALVASA